MIRKRLLSAYLALALCLSLLPATTLAAGEDAPAKLYVGDQQVIVAETVTYWSTNDSGGLTRVENATDNSANWSVRYNPTNATLTLNEAKISGSYNQYNNPFTGGIYAKGSSDQSVALTIELIGTNTITGDYGIYVDAQQGETVGTNASLLIRNSSDNGILEVSGSSHGIYVKSGTGNASLTIKDASVVASCYSSYGSYAGVCVHSGSDATSSPKLSLAVDGGSLTTSASKGNDGIQFYVGANGVTSETTSLSVTNNAIVDARTGGISASGVSGNPNVTIGSTGSTGGIVWNGSEGTVYGDVELQEDLEIGEGESLKLDNGASLNAGGHNVIVDGGTLDESLAESLVGSVIYKVTKVELGKTSLTLDVNESETLTATITPDNASNKNVTWESSNTNVATVDNTGKVTAVSEGTATITVTTADGGKTATCEVTVKPAEHTVTVLTDGKGSASASATTAAAGTTVTLTAKPDSGWRFSRWEVVEGDVTISGNSFTMPAENVIVRAVFSPVVNIPDTYDIDLIAGEGGEAKLSLTNASEGSTITVTATPDAGYELDYITVDGERIDGTTFKMPNHDVTVRVYFTDGSATLPFTDVSTGAWYFDAVSYVYANGLMDGVSDTLFDPDGTMTRAMVWAILARVDGETVTGDGWIETAREWAVAEGVSDGENANGYVTREQFATMLWRYAGEPETDGSGVGVFDDGETVSIWAFDAMSWAVEHGIITGMTDTTLVPQGSVTRAQCAAMLMRFVENIG